MDSTTCTIQIGSSGTGTASINGGYLQIDTTSGFGILNFAANLDFAGTLKVAVQGGASGTGNCDLLNMLGNPTLNPNSDLQVEVSGNLVSNKYWVVINNNKLFDQNNNFASTNLAALGLTPSLNDPRDGNYKLKS